MTQPKGTGVSATSADVRARLVNALRLDLVGPWPGHEFADEKLPGWIRPSNWYLTGFLIPSGAPPEQRGDEDSDEDFEEVQSKLEFAEEDNEERKAAKKSYFPSSMGLSFLVSAKTKELEVLVRWGDYQPTELAGNEENKPVRFWQRHPREVRVSLVLQGAAEDSTRVPVPGSDGLELEFVERAVLPGDGEDKIPAGTSSVSIFLVNRRIPIEKGEADPDIAYVFQPELEVRGSGPFVPRPDLRGAQSDAWDERVGDLHYAAVPEYAVGHGVSADWQLLGGACHTLRTTWVPGAEVEKTTTERIEGVELEMERLGALADGAAAEAALRPLVEQYRSWIAAQSRQLGGLSPKRRETAEELLRLAGLAARRIEGGIAIVTNDADALDAFRVANRAVARALRKRLAIDKPAWRAFQLAFVLLNLPGLADPQDANRETVDLLFFPTGGGKTEAYLGLAAFTMVLRRLRNPEEQGRAGAGVSVIMRYTLRLLTLDQLVRAAGLVCALELERDQKEGRYGIWPFEIGLWVGKAATPNILGRKGDGRQDTARSKVHQFKSDPKAKPSPIPLENCPWCNRRFEAASFSLRPNSDEPTDLKITCVDIDCEFSGERGLPVVAIDEPLYRRLPAFLIATVDKFASLPWVGQSGALLGGADRFDKNGFYGAADPGQGAKLKQSLPPPDLIIQDELHLISGPLGTMAGLYETAIEALCLRQVAAGQTIRPKIVASTATVRQASNQVQALFGRGSTQIFPPPGPNRGDTFFARTPPAWEVPPRLYLGIASQGRNPKVVMRKTLVALMSAAERLYRDSGGHQNPENPVDPYMTLLGYFNSLRELGGARRILEEEVQNTIKEYGQRKRVGESPGMFQDRKNFSEVVELTSREPTNKVADARRRLGVPFFDIKQRVDCAIATNMISVGLDIPRLGLMVVVGQPKTHSEYIQATSRVGRDDQKPGLVITLLNVHKPRDRSHYERFRHYHETFYRSVEVGSVTPFSARALDRGFAGAMVGLARHVRPELTPPRGVEKIGDVRAALETRLLHEFLTRVDQQPIGDPAELQERRRGVQDRVVDLLDSWLKVFEDYRTNGVPVQYQKHELKQPKPLLREMLDTTFDTEHHRKFRANRSLRDVEPAVNLFLRDLNGNEIGADV